jgi:hypothetical protein
MATITLSPTPTSYTSTTHAPSPTTYLETTHAPSPTTYTCKYQLLLLLLL